MADATILNNVNTEIKVRDRGGKTKRGGRNWEIKERERSHGSRLSGLITRQRELASLKARHLIYSVQPAAATETAN